MEQKEDPLWAKVGVFFLYAALASWLAAAGIVGTQIWTWLAQGWWWPLDVATTLDDLGISVLYPQTSLVGLQRIIDWLVLHFLDLPASLFFFLLGAVCSGIFGWADQRAHRQ